ncbi:transcriptional regulator family: Fungal Specific TF [Penicillium coprophilum]|uniref:transcriptional regulator family: Fungal Specific TF n=1 Tax=Penicillium coprophilum TaxID=36646 RepID=UPI002391C209|nr:transcriptional regulator family: Fungal Specific TF [Penicillium coprophilum]KAJ5164842.1 transcriptional regulator family: Fungal Specific TF [Penicillium coprophilum]
MQSLFEKSARLVALTDVAQNVLSKTLPQGYVARSLESRVVYLEARLQESLPDISLRENDQHELTSIEPIPPFVPVTSVQTSEALASTQLRDSQGAYTNSSHTHGASLSILKDDAGKVDHLSSEVALLCLNAAGGEPHYFGPSSAVSFSRIISATMGLKSEQSLSSPRHLEDLEEIPSDIRPDRTPRLPPPSVSANLSRAYFDNIHPQYPFLHRPTFCEWEQNVREASQSVQKSAAIEAPLFFTLMV